MGVADDIRRFFAYHGIALFLGFFRKRKGVFWWSRCDFGDGFGDVFGDVSLGHFTVWYGTER